MATTSDYNQQASVQGTTTEQKQFMLDDYVIQEIDNRPVNQVDYNTLNALLDSEGVRISKHTDAVPHIRSVRGQDLKGEYFIQTLKFPHGFGTQGIFSPNDPITPELGEDRFFVIEQSKQGSTMLETRETTKEMINYLVYSMNSNKPVLIIQRPFKNVFHKLYVYDGHGTYYGNVIKRSGILSSKLIITDPQGNEIISMKASKMHGWSDLWMKNLSTKEKTGMMTTRWTGGANVKKGVNINTLDIIFPTSSKLSERCLLLAAGIFVEMIFLD